MLDRLSECCTHLLGLVVEGGLFEQVQCKLLNMRDVLQWLSVFQRFEFRIRSASGGASYGKPLPSCGHFIATPQG